jgi:hypothetical protein
MNGKCYDFISFLALFYLPSTVGSFLNSQRCSPAIAIIGYYTTRYNTLHTTRPTALYNSPTTKGDGRVGIDQGTSRKSPDSEAMYQQHRQYYTYKKPHVKQFQKNGIFYKSSLLTQSEFQVVQELSSLSLNLVKETTSSVANNRIGAQLPPDSRIVEMIANSQGTFTQIINEIVEETTLDEVNGANMVLSNTVPVEMRMYEQKGAGMETHYDDVLFSPEQIEVVFTVENNSDCVTRWEEFDANGEAKWTEVETEPNSAIILRAGSKGARHGVSALKSGKRIILKFVFVREDALVLDGVETHAKQFASLKGHKAKKTKRKR